MAIQHKYEPRVYSINDFLSWSRAERLELSAKFQRRAVWQRTAKSYLIDTLVRGLPIPHVYIRERIDPDSLDTVREIVDGQQRIRTILGFIQGEVTILPRHNEDYAGMKFSELTEVDRRAILAYPVPVAVLLSASDAEVIEVFSRLNAYTLPLNRQEKLNAKYFGRFKTSVYRMGGDHLEFWRQNRILTEHKIARMGEADLAGELLVLMLDGIQPGKSRIETFYRDFDESFVQEKEMRSRFGQMLTLIYDLLGTSLRQTRYRALAQFYSLYAALYHLEYGLPRLDYDRFAVSRSRFPLYKERLLELIHGLDEDGDVQVPVPFLEASSSSTDNQHNRGIRTRFVLDALSEV